MKPLTAFASVCSIAGVILTLAQGWLPHPWTTWIGLALIATGFGTIVLIARRRIPVPDLDVQIKEVEVCDTGAVLKHESGKTLEVRSSSEHVAVLLRGVAKGELRPEEHLTAYAVVAPSVDHELLFVQRAEGDHLDVVRDPKFEVKAYLGGIGESSARDGDMFQVRVLVAGYHPAAQYRGRAQIPKESALSAKGTRLKVRRE